MPGPNSCPNGDTTVMRGSTNERFVCYTHNTEGFGDKCTGDEKCKIVPLRWYLESRGKLRTGKTK